MNAIPHRSTAVVDPHRATLPDVPDTGAVWNALSADLRRFFRRRVADEHVAEDLLQETFLRIHRHLASIRSGERLAAWVYRIARNVVHDHYRDARGDVAPLAGDPAGDPAADSASDVPQPSLRLVDATWIEELIRQVPEPYQTAVRLSEIDGLPQREIARREGLTLSGAKSRVQRGRAMLRQTLERCCEFRFDRRGNLLECDPRPDRVVCHDCDETDRS